MLSRAPFPGAKGSCFLYCFNLHPYNPCHPWFPSDSRFNDLRSNLAKPFVPIRVHSWLKGTSLTASYEAQIKKMWERTHPKERMGYSPEVARQNPPHAP
jgi:hypothetical protein